MIYLDTSYIVKCCVAEPGSERILTWLEGQRGIVCSWHGRPEFFSAIVLCQSLEHMRNPVVILAECYRILAPGGLLVVDVPNSACEDASFFGDAWGDWALPFHLFHWSSPALIKAAASAGLVAERIRFKYPSIRQTLANYERMGAGKPGRIGFLMHAAKVQLMKLIRHEPWRYAQYMALYARKKESHV